MTCDNDDGVKSHVSFQLAVTYFGVNISDTASLEGIEAFVDVGVAEVVLAHDERLFGNGLLGGGFPLDAYRENEQGQIRTLVGKTISGVLKKLTYRVLLALTASR